MIYCVKCFALHSIFTDVGMFEKNMSIGFLLDFYGEILGERKRGVLDMYYNEDLSLSEISGIIGISRQGVRDLIKKASEELLFYEDKLGLAGRFGELKSSAERILLLAGAESLPPELNDELRHLASLVQ